MNASQLFVALLVLQSSSVAQDPTPADRFVFPDEWEAHDGTIMIFPARHSYNRRTRALQRESANLANAIQDHEQVHMFVHRDDADAAGRLLNERVTVHVSNAYRIDWPRDNAPLIVRNDSGDRQAVCFRFNGWGKKYVGWEDDVGVHQAIATALELPIVESDFVLEGGAIEIGSAPDGQIGIVTEQCVLNPNRTDWPKPKIERELKDKLGLTRIVWLGKGLNPDPITDGHVDGLLKFVAKNTVLLHTTDDKRDLNYAICQDAKQRLERAGLEVVELPLAWDIVHMNFYIGSGGDVAYVPICGDKEQDEPALNVIRELFEKVVPIRGNAMSKAGGGVHCYTQQIPATRRK